MPESLLVVGVIVLALGGLKWAYDRWIASPAKPSDFGLAFDDAGWTVAGTLPTSVPVRSLAWNEIVRVAVYKRDLLTVDRICLACTTVDGTMTEVNEDMEGWEALTDALPTYLKGCKNRKEWFPQVAFPAFATNELVIFERQSE